MARVHDPGQEAAVTLMPDGRWAVDSWTGARRYYVVDAESGTCSCPHYQTRLAGTGEECKHLTSVRRRAARGRRRRRGGILWS